MNIVMFTNTFTPHVGGVARSVSGLADNLHGRGHRVLVIAPQFPGGAEDEDNVIRVPAVQRFGGSDFSVPLPLTRPLSNHLDAFRPDIVHSHHPFLLGDTALRVSALRDLPVVFTFHTRYELYGHYVAQNSERLKRLVQSLTIGYCNLCNAVIAPSASIADYLKEQLVSAPISVIPTGIDIESFEMARRDSGRSALALDKGSFVVGHVGRLAPEKNLAFLTSALIVFLRSQPAAIAVITGDGASRPVMEDAFKAAGLADRVRMTGVLTGTALRNTYAAMDIFAFSSLSETQGLVLVEAMAAGVPVIALDAPGAREVVSDRRNGRLLAANAQIDAFAGAVADVARMTKRERQRLSEEARHTALQFSADRCLDRVLSLYGKLCGMKTTQRSADESAWETARRSLSREVDIITNIARAVGDAVLVLPSVRPEPAATP